MDPNEGLTGTAGIPLSLSASLTYWLKYNLYEIDHCFFFWSLPHQKWFLYKFCLFSKNLSNLFFSAVFGVYF